MFRHRSVQHRLITFIIGLFATIPCLAQDASPNREEPRAAIAQQIKKAYGTDVSVRSLRSLPIGLFDSGTGGLTVLEQVLTLDEFNNEQRAPGSDGKPDFSRESFVFLADQANMPYGNYPSVDREKFLEHLIVKDAEFLMRRRYYDSPNAKQAESDKLPVKAIVIACNTATAYGQDDIQDVVARAGLDIKVIGVIDAGARGALTVLKDGQPSAIGVIPTRGTVLSKAYPQAIRANAKRLGMKQSVQVVQQGAVGLAGAIDGDSNFIDRNAKDHRPRTNYKGPSLTNPIAKIDLKILKRYGFDYSENRMLYDGTATHPTELQLNSVENYIAYHVVTLLESLRKSDQSQPLRAIILGCTHFPFFKDTFRTHLHRLYDHRENGEYVYRRVMAKDIELIDPAYFTARELYRSLAKDEKFRDSDGVSNKHSRGEFYITMPCRQFTGVQLNDAGGFTYKYKYSRKLGHPNGDYRSVPLVPEVLEDQASERLKTRVPAVWKLITEFRQAKTNGE